MSRYWASFWQTLRQVLGCSSEQNLHSALKGAYSPVLVLYILLLGRHCSLMWPGKHPFFSSRSTANAFHFPEPWKTSAISLHCLSVLPQSSNLFLSTPKTLQWHCRVSHFSWSPVVYIFVHSFLHFFYMRIKTTRNISTTYLKIFSYCFLKHICIKSCKI